MDEQQVNPILMEFLEEEDLEKKDRILVRNIQDIDSHCVLSMAAAMDFVLDEKKDVIDMVNELRTLLKTRMHFENKRFR